MPRNQRATTAVAERPRTRNSGGANELPVKPPRAKRAAEDNLNTKSRKRAAFGDLTNVSLTFDCFSLIFQILNLFIGCERKTKQFDETGQKRPVQHCKKPEFKFKGFIFNLS